MPKRQVDELVYKQIDEKIIQLRETQDLKLQEVADIINNEYGVSLSPSGVKSRYRRAKGLASDTKKQAVEVPVIDKYENSETLLADGSIISQKVIEEDTENLIRDIRNAHGNKEKILQILGFDNDEFELTNIKISSWDQKGKKGDKQLHSLRYQVKPCQLDDITVKQKCEIAKELFSKSIIPFQEKPIKKIKGLDKNKMMELTGIELHLGKLAFKQDTTQDYNYKIAQERFNHIINEVIDYQKYQKADTCLLCIGNDFFNYDTIQGTTTKGTPQANDLTYRTMFNVGLTLYTKAILKLAQIFNKVEVRLQNGNHDKITCFHLFIALDCYFKNVKNVNFSNNYRDVQCFEWGDCAIFFTHGGNRTNKRLPLSIPSEFSEEWGRSKYREAHIGHTHHEMLTQEENGLICRTVSSPTATDNWHYENRYVGSLPKYQVFIWDKNIGMTDIKHIYCGQE